MSIVWGMLIPFLGTTLGAMCVWFLRKDIKAVWQKIMLGFASGVMIAASIWSLLTPAIEMSSFMGKLSFLPATTGFVLGISFLFAIDKIVPHLHMNKKIKEGIPSKMGNTSMLIMAVNIHNIPEGMAVGVALAGSYYGGDALLPAYVLAIGIAIQNIPEGAIISLPLLSEGNSKLKSFSLGVVSGLFELAGAIVAFALAGVATATLPYFLAFAAGAMIFVVFEELWPEASKDGNGDVAIIGFSIGFVIMMILDLTLG